jgi:dihydropteroate synthase
MTSPAPPRVLRAGHYSLTLDQPLIMGVVNVTPDSFSDGGKFATRDAAIAHARSLVRDGAHILDIGGESTRPGAQPASVDEELARVIPVIEGLADIGVPLSIDTQKPEVMRAAIAAGASIVNDVNALGAPGAIEVCAQHDVAVCLMHMQGIPRTMQATPQYDDVLVEVENFLHDRARACEAAGIAADRIVLDPGIGFGKSLEHNLSLLRHIERFIAPHSPYALLVGVSRKSMFKALLGLEVDERLMPSVLVAAEMARRGTNIVRVHDVRETRDALTLLKSIS